VSLLYICNIFFLYLFIYLFIGLRVRKIKFNHGKIAWLYLVIQILCDSTISCLAKFGFFKSSYDNPLAEIKVHLGRYSTYMPYMRVCLFRINSEDKSASGLESVLKEVIKQCQQFTFTAENKNADDILNGILYI